MPENVIQNVQTKPVGFAPILTHYFKKCGVVEIIDEHVPLDARRKILTHGQACLAMITAILFQVMQLYKICFFAFDHGLFLRKRKSLESRIEKTRSAFDELASRINAYRLKTLESIDKACKQILEKYQTSDLFEYVITNDPELTRKNSRKGGPYPADEKVPVARDRFSIHLSFDETACQKALERAGYYPLVANKPGLSVRDAMMAHKNQYKTARAMASYPNCPTSKKTSFVFSESRTSASPTTTSSTAPES